MKIMLVFMVNFLKKTVNVKLEDGKIKEYQKDDIEMIDGEVNIDIDINPERILKFTYLFNSDIIFYMVIIWNLLKNII